jgi:hypothetical protein
MDRHGTGTSLFLATLAPVVVGDGVSMQVVIKMPRWGIPADEVQEVSEEIEHEVSTELNPELGTYSARSARSLARLMFAAPAGIRHQV